MINRREYMVAGAAATTLGVSVGFSDAATTSSETATFTTDFSGYTDPEVIQSKVITSFEDGNLSEYSELYSGAKESYDVVSESTVGFNARDGTEMLRVGSSAGPIHSSSGLENYFSKGKVSEVYVRFAGTDATTFIGFGGGDWDNSYYLQCNPNDLLRLRKHVNGSQSTLDGNYGFGWKTNTWYRIEIQWLDDNGNSDITADVYDTTDSSLVGSVSSTDSASTLQDNQGIVFNKSGSDNSYIDYWRLINS